MNILLIFFAIPLAVIILSAILETFINCPFKVAGIFFAIFIVVAFALGGSAILIVAAIVYTLISFITAAIVRLIINRMCNRGDDDENRCRFCRDECSSCNSDNTASVSNQLNNTLRSLNELNTFNSLNNLANLNNLNNLNNEAVNNINNFNNNTLNTDVINQLTRSSQNTFNTNNTCRRCR